MGLFNCLRKVKTERNFESKGQIYVDSEIFNNMYKSYIVKKSGI